MRAPVILSSVLKNSRGEPAPIVLNASERHQVLYMMDEIRRKHNWGPFKNALGAEVAITTLTTIVKKVSEQKLYTIAPADLVPIKVGQGTWGSNLETYRSFDIGDQFESGIINQGVNNTRLSAATSAVDALNIKINNWAKTVGWTIFEIEQASRTGNWDLVSSREKSRKRNWDLGIQRIAFLGAKGQNSGSNPSCLGLLNQVGVTFDTTLITQTLSSMSPTQISTFQQQSMQRYRANCNYTAWPTHFAIPESDYDGLAAQASPTFPMKSILAILEEGFQLITKNKNFKILPLAYAQYNQGQGVLPTQVAGGAGSGIYTFLNYDEESLRMDVPLSYTNTLANSLDNFMFQNVGYGQFTGVLAYRPAEMYYAGF